MPYARASFPCPDRSTVPVAVYFPVPLDRMRALENDGARAGSRPPCLACGARRGCRSALKRAPERARTRGGGAAVAAFMARAVELTPKPARHHMRALAAARAAHEAETPKPP
jgi:hypothetical protein